MPALKFSLTGAPGTPMLAVVATPGYAPMYEVFDRRTGAVVATVATRKGARASVDRRDNAYGAYRYGYRVKGSAGESL